MANYFPSQKDNLKRYFDLVELVAGASSVHSLKNAESDSAINTEYQLRSINEVIDSYYELFKEQLKEFVKKIHNIIVSRRKDINTIDINDENILIE